MRSYTHIEELQKEFAARREAIHARIAEFAGVKPNEYFYELVYCLLTPQSRADHAGKAVEKLRAAQLFEREVNAAGLLREKDAYIRFHNTKARRLAEAKARFPEIVSALSNGRSSVELREWLARNLKGLGWKEASHFLRNIGHRDLAILDRHILKNLKRHGVIRSIPKTLTPKRYLAIEKKFSQFSRVVGIAMDELDLLFWSRETGVILK
jgi:N-glycosylase/DNA lyase